PRCPGLLILDGGAQHRFVQAMLADIELGGVHAHRQSAGPGVDVVAGERALALAVEPALRIQGKGVGGNDRALRKLRQDILGKIGSLQGHVGSCMGGYPNSGPAMACMKAVMPCGAASPSAMRAKPRCGVKPAADRAWRIRGRSSGTS